MQEVRKAGGQECPRPSRKIANGYFGRDLMGNRNFPVVALLLATVAGCSRSRETPPPDVVPVSGTLTYRGEPVADARLTFWADDESEPAFALTDRQGRFRCVSNDADGIASGEYLVTVSRAGGGIPEKYADADSSPLRVSVEQEDANLVIKLED